MTMIISGSTGLEFPDGSDQTSAFTGNASAITSGTVATARLGSGTADNTTYLRGDQTWATVTQTRISGGTTGLTPSTLTGGDVTLAGTLAVANGGTGATTLTANNVLLGNGTSALQVVAPGTSGNVLTSNGTTWTSAGAPAPTTAQVLSATAGATAGAVGTYAFLYQSSDTGNIAFGGTKAGNLLVAAISSGGPQTSSAVSGTWRCMGHTNTSLYSTAYTTVWLRIA